MDTEDKYYRDKSVDEDVVDEQLLIYKRQWEQNKDEHPWNQKDFM